MRHIRIVVSAAAAAVLAARGGFAQHVSVAAVGSQTTHALLPRATGVGGTLTVPLSRRVGLSVLVERTSGRAAGRGVVCAGLVDPDRCPTGPFEQRASPLLRGARTVPLHAARTARTRAHDLMREGYAPRG